MSRQAKTRNRSRYRHSSDQLIRIKPLGGMIEYSIGSGRGQLLSCGVVRLLSGENAG